MRDLIGTGLCSGEEYKLGYRFVIKDTVNSFKVGVIIRNNDCLDIYTSCKYAGYLRNVIRKLYLLQSGTAGESVLLKGKLCTVFRKGDRSDSRTVTEGLLVNELKRCGELDLGNGCTIHKRALGYSGDTASRLESEVGKSCTASESILTNGNTGTEVAALEGY